jgi:peptidoglycan/xylan/chitin deacetylase (PgdA/CDA1 family)
MYGSLHKQFRRAARALWAFFLRYSGAIWFARRHMRRAGSLNVLMFHRVLDRASQEKTNSLPDIVISLASFRRLLRFLREEYEIVRLDEHEPGCPTARPRVAITFDDGWSDNYLAHRILAAHRIAWTLFVCSGLCGNVAPFWPERAISAMRTLRTASDDIRSGVEALKRLSTEDREAMISALYDSVRAKGLEPRAADMDSTMPWQHIQELDLTGVSIGAHTQSHQILTRVPLEVAEQEIIASKRTIEDTLNQRCTAFAYPNGDYSDEILRLVADARFTFAVTTRPGLWLEGCDPLAIPRNNICEENVVGLTGKFSPAMFEYTTIWKPWRQSRVNPALQNSARPSSASQAQLS